ncbi:nat2p [Saccharomyces arboricola H-6]|uniref:Nat2p n=1 Tax=Saccharomyces arboricola (strain H-6 / AS 2.3317 / CBS 10644) TaxID=1160507 RepID=J8Q7F4_SACAR|nr:nat2p [Saccharomyces arboricola H-6]
MLVLRGCALPVFNKILLRCGGVSLPIQKTLSHIPSRNLSILCKPLANRSLSKPVASISLTPVKRFYAGGGKNNGHKEDDSGSKGGSESNGGKKAEQHGIKGLIAKYGYSALIVYILLTCVDLPLCFLGVHSLGEEKIKIYFNRGKQLIGKGEQDESKVIEQVRKKQAHRAEIQAKNADNVEDASKKTFNERWQEVKDSTLLAELLIAYGIHKSLIIIRVPLTALLTPAFVKLLQKLGIDLMKKQKKVFQTMASGAKIRYKGNNPSDFIKNDATALDITKRKPRTKSQKWFNGLM